MGDQSCCDRISSLNSKVRLTNEPLLLFPYENIGQYDGKQRPHGATESLLVKLVIVDSSVLGQCDVSELANGIDGDTFHLYRPIVREKFTEHMQ